MIVLRESDKMFEGQLNIDGLIGVLRFKLGRNSKIEWAAGTDELSSVVLIVSWIQVGAYLGCALGDEVISFRKLSFCSPLEVSENVGMVKHVVVLKHFVT